MFENLDLLPVLFPQVLLLYLPVYLLCGVCAAVYTVLLEKISSKRLAAVVPVAVVALWMVWAAAVATDHAFLLAVNLSAFFVFHPMIVVALLPLVRHYAHPGHAWAWAAVVAAVVLIVRLTQGALMSPMTPVAPPVPGLEGFLDELVKGCVSTLKTGAYALVGYAVLGVLAHCYREGKAASGAGEE
ncbi:uncharacterized membrane protein YuzA (DUF378 family) [Methanofollis sp. W23]|uniref:hypothetical protein n=1 Tax=Methanofollis sp. W23 TaxID=2817849 RepID=UPI001AE28756|nr:hypothetical protein [Methanofollis sp. W23]MBP2146962.1 uncharacterized membrane protein YuzA (DUF378 family) [Methanofollis sp. W23]